MKLIFIIIIGITLQSPIWAQSIDDTSGILTFAEQMPEFSGNLKMFIRTCENPDTSGRVVVKFIVDTVGEISHLSIAKSLIPKLDSEAIRMIRLLPSSWIPATMNGKKVAVWTMLPVDFKVTPLINPEHFPEPKFDVNSFICKNLRYPDKAREEHIEGRVVTAFIIDSSGELLEPRIISSPSPLLSEEALRVIQIMPKWKPGEQNGHKVSVYLTLPMVFKLGNTERR